MSEENIATQLNEDKYLILVGPKDKCVMQGNEGGKISIIQQQSETTTSTDFEIVGVNDAGGHSIVPTDNTRTFMEKQTYLHFVPLQEELKGLGILLTLTSAGRTMSEQEQIRKDNYSVAVKADESEHLTGLSFDINIKIDKNIYNQHRNEFNLPELLNYGEELSLTPNAVDKAKIINALLKIFANYGFIQRYPEGKSHITNSPSSEWWHIRYVGVQNAKVIYNQSITLEEYLQALGKDIKISNSSVKRLWDNSRVRGWARRGVEVVANCEVAKKLNKMFIGYKHQNEDTSLIRQAIEEHSNIEQDQDFGL